MLLSYIMNPLITPPDGQRSARQDERRSRGACAVHWVLSEQLATEEGIQGRLQLCDQVDQASYFDRQLNDVFWKEEERA